MSIQSIQKQRYAKRIKAQTMAVISAIYIAVYIHICHVMSILDDNPRMEVIKASEKAFKTMLNDPFTPVIEHIGFLPAYLLGGMALVLLYNSQKKPKTEHLEDNHFMTCEELKAYNRECVEPFGKANNNPDRSLIYTEDLWLSYINETTQMNMNAIITAGSGKGKTFYFLTPNLLHLYTNAVVTDPSMELTKRHGKDLENRGYEVMVFNTKNPYKGLRYNPFRYIHSETDAVILIHTFIDNTEGKGKDKDKDFWVKCEFFLLTALSLYMYHTMPLKERTFRTILKLMKDAEIDENDASAKSELDRKFEELERRDPENTAVAYYKDFKVGAGKTLKSILISVNARLSKLELPAMQYLTDEDELDLETFADKKKVLFVCIPTGDHTFDFIVSMLYSQLFMKLYAYAEDTAQFGYSVALPDSGVLKVFRADSEEESPKAKKEALRFKKILLSKLSVVPNKKKKYYEIQDSRGQVISWRGTREAAENFCTECKNAEVVRNESRCPIHVQLFCDEFANISQIPDFCAKLSTIRKYAIGCSIILQGIGQLEKNYKDEWEDITSNCDIKLCLGNTDKKTIKWFQELLGKREIITRSESHASNGNVTVSYSPHSVDMLSGYKISQMDKRYCVAIISDHSPVYGLKYRTKNDPRFAECMKTKNQLVVEERKAQKYVERDIPLIEREKAQRVSFAELSRQPHPLPDIKKDSERIKNLARKETSLEAKKALDDFEEYSEQEEDIVLKNLCEAFGITKDTTENQIREIVESMVVLSEPPKDGFTYKATG